MRVNKYLVIQEVVVPEKTGSQTDGQTDGQSDYIRRFFPIRGKQR